MPRDEGFDPQGDGPEFRSDTSKSDLPPAEAQAFAIRMSQVRRARKSKKEKPPTDKELERGRRAQEHMNSTQFGESGDEGKPNPKYDPNDSLMLRSQRPPWERKKDDNKTE